MVYTDGKHLVADNINELHRFAQSIGLKRKWFQDHRIPHYDLTTWAIYQKAHFKGAIDLSTRDLIRKVT